MRYKTIVAASAAAAAAAAIPCGTAAASTPDWLTLVSLETDQASMLPVLCGEQPTGTFVDPACQGLFGTGNYDAESYGVAVPDAPEGYEDLPAVANVDLRNAARWEVCGVAAASTTEGVECENAIAAEEEPVGSDNGVALLNADATGAFNWSVCGITLFGETSSFNC
ncbi:hypothetical protein [Glycomyces tarimensis]